MRCVQTPKYSEIPSLPTYDYRCEENGHSFEIVQGFNSAPVATCPECGSASQRKISAAALHFKGSGWYVNDHGKKKSTPAIAKLSDLTSPGWQGRFPGADAPSTESALAQGPNARPGHRVRRGRRDPASPRKVGLSYFRQPHCDNPSRF